eukprot:TRINITY_DN63944_c0_g1_i1.p1 TRINITY_DN63944_c0_g1~~TRINITY_DN63944_c0_g1_i1.p1  ORF type:complete len:360 (-),score=50.69 TRINITY_DN63944_c0_g1_i1:258-1337(-)
MGDLAEDESAIPDGAPRDSAATEEHDSDHDALDQDYISEHERNTKVKTIKRMCMGKYTVDCWYFSPFPPEFQDIEVIHFCEFCLAFFATTAEVARHSRLCSIRHPPGDEIYRSANVSVFEVDGSYSRVYCENLCYIAKLFLDHKTLRHNVGLFLFYIVAEYDEFGYHLVGYFSKEKYSKNNLSCILTLPQHQRKGYGKFLISFSYELSKIECCLSEQPTENGSNMKRILGGPERPFSDLGRASYMCWWTPRLLKEIRKKITEAKESVKKGGSSTVVPSITIKALSEKTYISPEDVVDCLSRLGVVREHDGLVVLFMADSFVDELLKGCGGDGLVVHPEKVHWSPYEHFMAPYEFNPNTV